MVKIGADKLKKVFIGAGKIRKICIGDTKIWSGASVVSYYDGDTLIGTEEVDEGLDVLHPTLDMSKDGYTHVGWMYDDERVTSLVADGNPMTVIAIYLPNTYTVYSGSYGSTTFIDSDYTSGSYRGNVTAWDGWSVDFTRNFVVNYGDYQDCSLHLEFSKTSRNSFATFRLNDTDDTYISSYNDAGGQNYTTAQINDGENTFHGGVSSSGSSSVLSGYISYITLSNPKAWD